MSMQNNVCRKNETIMYKGIIYAIDIHRTAIKLVFIFTNNYIKLINITEYFSLVEGFLDLYFPVFGFRFSL